MIVVLFSMLFGQVVCQVKFGFGLMIVVLWFDFFDIFGGLWQSGYGGVDSGMGGGFLLFLNNGGDMLLQIVVDLVINVVIVCDLLENMYCYQLLIGQFDEWLCIVEINVMIIDINEDLFDSFGIDWCLYMMYGDVQIGNGQNVLNGNMQYNGVGNLLLMFGIGMLEIGQMGVFMLIGIVLIVLIGGLLCNYLFMCVNVFVQKGQV